MKLNTNDMKQGIIILSSLLIFSIFSVFPQMKAPQDWVGYEEVMGVKNNLRFYNFDVTLIESSAPANVFWPEDDINFKFQVVNNTQEPIDTDAKIHIIRYGTKGIPTIVFDIIYRYRNICITIRCN